MASPSWRVRPTESLVRTLSDELARNSVVFVQGSYGVGKTAHSMAAFELLKQSHPDAAFLEPNSVLGKSEFEATLRSPQGLTFVLVDKPARLGTVALDLLCEGVVGGSLRVVVESTGTEYLPAELAALKSQVNSFSLRIPELTLQEFHTELTHFLGGPIPIEHSKFFWSATGGNQELASLWVSEMRASGDVAVGKYAWAWSGNPAIPVALTTHVDRQLDTFNAQQRSFIERLALVASLPLASVTPLISDESLAGLRSAGFVRTHVLNSGAQTIRLAAPVVGWAIRHEVLPAQRTEIFNSTPVPHRAQLDPDATVAWAELAASEGVEMSLEMVQFAIECAFPIFRWDTIDAFADLKIPANKLDHLNLKTMVNSSVEDRGTYITILAQRGLSNFFLDKHDKAISDVRLARRLLEANPEGLDESALRVLQLERVIVRTFEDDGTLREHVNESIDGARGADDAYLVESFRVQSMSASNEDVMHRMPLDELLTLIKADPAQSPFAVGLAPNAILRSVLAGRIAEALELAQRTLGLREMRITFLPENALTLSYAELVSKTSYSYALVGQSLIGMKLMEDPVADNILDPATVQSIRGMAHIALGEWDAALHELRAALQRLEARDHLKSRKMALSGYMQALVAVGEHVEAVQVLRDYDSAKLGSVAIYESDFEYRALVVRYALSEPDFEQRLVRYLERFSQVGDWFGCLRAAHLGVVVGSQKDADFYLDQLNAASEHVDAQFADLFVRDAHAHLNKDAAQLANTRAGLGQLGVWIPELQARLKLTKRQREIAGLVALGLSNKDIAQRLFLSVRTVESHVAAVLEKVGTSDRRMLGARLAALS